MTKEELIKFYSINRAKIFPVAVALASLFLIIFIIYPQGVKLIDNQNVLKDLNVKSEFLETKVVALERYKGEDLSRKLGIILDTLPADKDFGNVLGLLQQLTERFGFITNSISFNNSTNKVGNVSQFGVKLNTKGSKVMFQTLLDNLEGSPRLIRISSIELSSKQDPQVFDSSLILEALYAGLPKDFGGIDSPLPELNQKDEEIILKLEELKRIELASSISSTSSGVESPRGKSNPFE